MQKKRIGLLGGSFDPVHIGHLIMANEAYQSLGLDEVRFMPNGAPPHKTLSGEATIQQRVKMVELAIAEIPYFKMEYAEVHRENKAYTYDTIMEIKENEPGHEWFFIIGGDMMDTLGSWYRMKDLKKQVQFIGFHRPGISPADDADVRVIDGPSIHLSSTFIRDRIKSGQNCKFLLPSSVEAYISKEGLYES
ncbi:nicotinate-nucleotide adenylyltransferase [Jeotgalibacillus sp. R-1-5s-1]|uniref:nicotinate-nucleotide adenylyltransferase n=1 Tax=Jeotgalibacillus sp. R-1-5s-1 TaxID=2555897 RepID=UPI001068ED22|nr:nicotinate-nucleotide adenylyltransferase [Jeotgalibacillus sp. R-1-5s-1]TFD92356.1 nicotinate-nucleotide adenylyltransferase [Jeotgalibacillus sp. R-1-5s-1]